MTHMITGLLLSLAGTGASADAFLAAEQRQTLLSISRAAAEQRQAAVRHGDSYFGFVVAERKMPLLLPGKSFVTLGHRLGSYRYLSQAVAAAGKFPKTKVIMRAGPNAFELYACVQDLGPEPAKSGLEARHPRAVAFIGADWDRGGFAPEIESASRKLEEALRAADPGTHGLGALTSVDPDAAAVGLGDSIYPHTRLFDIVATAFVLRGRLDRALELLLNAPEPFIAAIARGGIVEHFAADGRVAEAAQLIADTKPLDPNGSDDGPWLSVARGLAKLGRLEESSAIAARLRADWRPANELRRELAAGLIRAERYEDALRVAASMSDALNGIFTLEYSGGLITGEHYPPFKSLLYRDLVQGLAERGQASRALEILERGFPRPAEPCAGERCERLRAIYLDAARLSRGG